jgi:hypothetical protein
MSDHNGWVLIWGVSSEFANPMLRGRVPASYQRFAERSAAEAEKAVLKANNPRVIASIVRGDNPAIARISRQRRTLRLWGGKQ